MPANLPPQYFEAEKEYRAAKTPQEKVEALELMLAIMPKHKGTDRLRAELRTRIAKHTLEAQRRPSIARSGSIPFVKKEGAGQVALVGLPNVGKSQLVAAMTNASPEVADYPLTTKSPIPGMMQFENTQIQLVDLPPITDLAAKPWLPNLLRQADALLLVVELGNDPVSQMETTIEALEKFRLRPQGMKARDEAELFVIPKKALVVATKKDLDISGRNYGRLASQYGGELPIAPISAKEGAGLEELRRAIFEVLDIIRVYTKSPGQKPDLEEPVVLEKGSTVVQMAEAVHKDFRDKLKYALIWGSGKYERQQVKRDHVLEDGDVIELHI